MEKEGQVEQDPNQIWEMSRQTIEEVIKNKNLSASNIECMGITTQRASFCLWDKKSGKLYSNIITWQDKRAAQYAEEMTDKFFFKFLRSFTKIVHGITRSTKMLSASMLRFPTDYASIRTSYFLKTNPEVNELIQDPQTSIGWGTIDTWILWNLTEGRVHATDFSNCSATAMLDPFTLEWNTIVIDKLNIPTHILPEIKDTNADFGVTKLFGNGEIPIKCIVADQQASLFGQCCFDFGNIKVTNGTGSFIDLNTGNEPFASKRRLYPLIAWRLDGEIQYMLEGLSHNTGNILDWIGDELDLFEDPKETEEMAFSVESSEGVFFLPTFTSGISFPYWDEAKGTVFGLTLSTKKEHIVRAVLEGICFRIKDIVDGIMEDTGISIERINADGGVSQNKFFLQALANILGLEVAHSKNPETTALGAAFIAGLKSGFWDTKQQITNLCVVDKIYTPQISEEEREEKYSQWKDIVRRSLQYCF
ncbi:MAG: putative glycerol kinase [Promethearchaeota archaeon]|nr:MAG: putative glycerol kinase [Candidatus Lokiarchaeota archaeon]